MKNDKLTCDKDTCGEIFLLGKRLNATDGDSTKPRTVSMVVPDEFSDEFGKLIKKMGLLNTSKPQELPSNIKYTLDYQEGCGFLFSLTVDEGWYEPGC